MLTPVTSLLQNLGIVLAGICFAGCTAAHRDVVKLTDRGALSVDAQPVFPVGIYAGLEANWVDSNSDKVDALLADLADSPFDFIINYGDCDGSPDQTRRLLRIMRGRGIFNIASVKDLYPSHYLAPKGPFAGQDQDALVRSMVRAAADEPAVIGWYTSDEPTGDPTPILQQHQRVKAEDPRRPTLMVTHLSKPDELAPWVETADIIGVDPYPIPKRPVTQAADVVREMKRLAGDKPVWFVLQAFGGYQYEESLRDKPVAPSIEIVRKKRPTTDREIRCLTFAALAEGAQGLVVYYHKDLIEGVDANARWPAVKKLAKEVRDLSSILLAPDLAVEASKSSDEVRLRGKQTARGSSFIVANTSAQVQTCVIELPTDYSRATLRSGDCFYYLRDGKLLLILDGLESVVMDVN